MDGVFEFGEVYNVIRIAQAMAIHSNLNLDKQGSLLTSLALRCIILTSHKIHLVRFGLCNGGNRPSFHM